MFKKIEDIVTLAESLTYGGYGPDLGRSFGNAVFRDYCDRGDSLLADVTAAFDREDYACALCHRARAWRFAGSGPDEGEYPYLEHMARGYEGLRGDRPSSMHQLFSRYVEAVQNLPGNREPDDGCVRIDYYGVPELQDHLSKMADRREFVILLFLESLAHGALGMLGPAVEAKTWLLADRLILNSHNVNEPAADFSPRYPHVLLALNPVWNRDDLELVRRIAVSYSHRIRKLSLRIQCPSDVRVDIISGLRGVDIGEFNFACFGLKLDQEFLSSAWSLLQESLRIWSPREP